MDLDALLHGNFHQLGEAITDWEEMARELKRLSHDAGHDMKKKADTARWTGLNQQVTMPFIDKTAGEFGDAHTEAQTIANILKDTRGELISFRSQLQDAIDRALKKNLLVKDTGKGTFQITAYPERATADTPQDIKDFKDEIQGILKKAVHSDTTAAQVLTRIIDQSPYGFSDAKYKDRDSAATAVKEADDLANLMKDPAHMTPAQFDRAKKIMAKYKNDDLFSEQLALDLGPRGVVNFWSRVCDPQTNPTLYEARHQQLGELQKDLGLTLANATQSDSPAMRNWEKAMIAEGPRDVTDASGRSLGVTGFQVMSSLMGNGDFDDQFLTSYGKQLMSYERRMGLPPGQTWHVDSATGGAVDLDPAGTGSGRDPVTGYLKALSHSPDASTTFLNSPYHGKETNFQYLFDDRDWPHGQTVNGHYEGQDGYNVLGDAAEAGATGHPAGQRPTGPQPPHTAGQAALMSTVMHAVSDHPERLTKHPGLSDNFGQMAAEYMPDILQATANDPNGDLNKLFPVDGSRAQVDPRSAERFLFCVGEDPKGYANALAGERVYMHNIMNYQLGPDIPGSERYDDPSTTVHDASRTGATVNGLLNYGREEGDRIAGHHRDQEYNDAMKNVKSVVSTGAGIGTGLATSAIGSPVAGTIVGGVTSTVTGNIIDDLFPTDSTKHEDAGEAARETRTQRAESQGRTANENAASDAAAHHHVANPDHLKHQAAQGTTDGYSDANTARDEYLNDLRVHRSVDH